MASRIHSNGGPRKAPQPYPRSAPAPATPGLATAEWVSGTGNQNQPELRRLKKRQKEKARRQRRGEGRRNMAITAHNQVVGGAQHNSSEEKTTHQTADPAATRRRTEDVGSSSSQVVAVAVAVAVAVVAAEDIQVVAGRPKNEPSADNKVQAADLAVARRTEDVGSTSQVVAAAVETGTEVVVAASSSSVAVAVAGPPSASSFLATSKSDFAHDQQALARLRLGSLLLPLIENKLRRSKAGGLKTTTEQPAAKGVEEAVENASSPKQSSAEMAVVLRAEAVRLEEMAVAAKLYAEECAEELAEQLRLEERLLEQVIKQLDTRAQELSFKKKTCGLDTLGEADKVFEEMYTGKAPVEYGCVCHGSNDSGNTYTIDSSESTCDKQNSEGTGLEGHQCLPSPAARSPMPPVHPGVYLVNFKGTYYPVPPSPVQQQQPQQQASQAWAPEGCSSGAEHQTPMEDVQPQAFEYGHNAVGMGPSPIQSHMQQPHPFTYYGESFEGMELPTQQQYAPPPMAYGGDAAYPAQMPHEQPLHTAYRGNTEGSMLYPLEVPQYQQPFGPSEGYVRWGVYNQPPMLGYEGGGW